MLVLPHTEISSGWPDNNKYSLVEVVSAGYSLRLEVNTTSTSRRNMAAARRDCAPAGRLSHNSLKQTI